MNCVSEITNYVRAMKQSAFYPFCPHPHFILFVRIRILSFLSASAFYPFCPHPHFIPFVRIRILSLLSASAFYPFCPSACPSVRSYPRFIPTQAKCDCSPDWNPSKFMLVEMLCKLLIICTIFYKIFIMTRCCFLRN
jgi:endogenous inhibitor of DNA gyrase (YacG/DUF329 family)